MSTADIAIPQHTPHQGRVLSCLYIITNIYLLIMFQSQNKPVQTFTTDTFIQIFHSTLQNRVTLNILTYIHNTVSKIIINFLSNKCLIIWILIKTLVIQNVARLDLKTLTYIYYICSQTSVWMSLILFSHALVQMFHI